MKKIIDLFCGVGGLSYGFKKNNYKVVAAVDLWEEALLTYKYNFPEVETFNQDIKDFNMTMINFYLVDSRSTNSVLITTV